MSATIGIIGFRGRYGSWLKRFFEARGDLVIGSDKSTPITTEQVIAEADVVIFAVPIVSTLSVIKEAVPHSQKGQLWMDVTSIKVDPIEEMLRSRAEVVGLHPLCRPPDGLSMEGHTIVVCYARLSLWRTWVKGFLEGTQAHIRNLEAGPHDRLMLAEQNLVHLSTLMVATAMRRMKIPPEKLFDFTTPLSRLVWANVGRVFSQEPDLYLDIQIHNPETKEMILVCREFLQDLTVMVEGTTAGRLAFLNEFVACREYFGEEFLKKAARVFNDTLAKK